MFFFCYCDDCGWDVFLFHESTIARPSLYMALDYTQCCADIERAVGILNRTQARVAEATKGVDTILRIVHTNRVFGLVAEADLRHAHRRAHSAKARLYPVATSVAARIAYLERKRDQLERRNHLRRLFDGDDVLFTKLYRIDRLLDKRDQLQREVEARSRDE